MIKNHKIFRNKKGAEMLIDFWAILVFALIVLIAFMVFSAEKKNTTNEINAMFDGKDSDYMLQSFLRAPAIGIDSKRTVADIIIEDYYSGEFSRTEQLFGEYYKYSSSIGSGKINDIVLMLNDEDVAKIVMEDGEGTFGKIVKIVVEETVSAGEKIITQGRNPGIHEDHRTYEAQTVLPSYTGRIDIKLEISAWVIDV